MRKLTTILITIFTALNLIALSQTFSYSGYIYNSAGQGIANVPVKVYKRTTPIMTGFTSQTNYNGHSYYRSTTSTTWLNSKAACENMGGHLATISNAAENSFLFNTWPSGWIGYYQDKTGAFYTEPLGGWRWTENYVTTGRVNNWDVAGYATGPVLSDSNNGNNINLTNSPIFTSTGGRYLTFNGVNQYGITPSLTQHFGTSKVITIIAWVFPTGNGVIASELGVSSPSSGWHESIMEITGGNTLRVGFWNGTGITQLSTPITLNQWTMIAMTYDGTTLTGYRNGASFGSVNFNRQAPHVDGGGNQVFAIGLSDATNMGSGAFGNFRLGAFQVYNTTLNLDQINRCWMSLSYRFGLNPYLSWNGGEPNNSGSEDYAQFVGSGLWNDLPNGVSLPYVLEFDYVVTYTSWVLETTVFTNANGQYVISQATNPSIERYVEISSLTIPTITSTDAQSPYQTVLGVSPVNAKKYYLWDVNNDSRINITDIYYMNGMISGRFANWINPLPRYRIFTTPEFNIINSNSNDLRSTYPGSQSVIINSPINGGSTNYYLLRTGFSL
jgi:hypothetical protein